MSEGLVLDVILSILYHHDNMEEKHLEKLTSVVMFALPAKVERFTGYRGPRTPSIFYAMEMATMAGFIARIETGKKTYYTITRDGRLVYSHERSVCENIEKILNAIKAENVDMLMDMEKVFYLSSITNRDEIPKIAARLKWTFTHSLDEVFAKVEALQRP